MVWGTDQRFCFRIYLPTFSRIFFFKLNFFPLFITLTLWWKSINILDSILFHLVLTVLSLPIYEYIFTLKICLGFNLPGKYSRTPGSCSLRWSPSVPLICGNIFIQLTELCKQFIHNQILFSWFLFLEERSWPPKVIIYIIIGNKLFH